MSGKHRKSRRLTYEIFTLAAVSALPTVFFSAFPLSSVWFRADPVRPRPAFTCAFVNLTPEQSAEAIAATRTSWMVEASDAKRMKGRLHLGELPETDPPTAPYFPVKASEIGRIGYDFPLLPPTLAAGAPERIESGPPQKETEPPQAFSRKELLGL